MGAGRGGVVMQVICVGAFVLVVLGSLGVSDANTFSAQNRAPNTPGGRRYTREMGHAWTVNMLQDIRPHIVTSLSLSPKRVEHVTFILEDTDAYAFNLNNEIHVGAKFLAGIKGNLRFEIKGLMYHELCHSFQNLGNYGSDAHLRGVVEGIATYMELTAGYGVGPKRKGGKWYDGYHTTAHFFAWIDKTHRKNFVNHLNQRIGQVKIWNDNFFVYLTRKNVNTLWALYQKSF